MSKELIINDGEDKLIIDSLCGSNYLIVTATDDDVTIEVRINKHDAEKIIAHLQKEFDL